MEQAGRAVSRESDDRLWETDSSYMVYFNTLTNNVVRKKLDIGLEDFVCHERKAWYMS